ncbi:hypothetical protein, partial [Paenibacillus macerans]
PLETATVQKVDVLTPPDRDALCIVDASSTKQPQKPGRHCSPLIQRQLRQWIPCFTLLYQGLSADVLLR